MHSASSIPYEVRWNTTYIFCRRSMSICDSIAWTIQGQSTLLCKAAQLCIAFYSKASTCRLFAIRQGQLSANCCRTVTMTRYTRVRRVRYYGGLGAHNAGRPDCGARGPADHGGVGQTPDAVEDPTARTGSDGAGAGPSSYGRLAARRGKQRAIMAVAHAIMVSVFHMLTR